MTDVWFYDLGDLFLGFEVFFDLCYYTILNLCYASRIMSSGAVIDLNNLAVACFQRGYHDRAVKSLKSAINQLLGSLGTLVEGQASQVSTSFPSLSCANDFSCRSKKDFEGCQSQDALLAELEKHSPLYVDHVYRILITKPPSQPREAESAASMYSHALVLAKDQSCISSRCFYNQTSVVLLYNLALIHHWRAVHLGISCGLSKALRLYEMALEVVQQRGVVPPMENLALAILNNMGHIHSHIFNFSEARRCFDSLRLLLSQRSEVVASLPKEDYETFFLSAMFQGVELNLAPAA